MKEIEISFNRKRNSFISSVKQDTISFEQAKAHWDAADADWTQGAYKEMARRTLERDKSPFTIFLEGFTDEQVGLDAAHVSMLRDNEIMVTRHLDHIKEIRERRAGNGKPFSNENAARLATEEWMGMAEELVEILAREEHGEQKWYVATCYEHGFKLRKED